MNLSKLRRLIWLTGLLLGAVLLIAACGGATPESDADPYAESGNEQPVAQQQAAVEEPTVTSAPTDTPVPATPTDEPATVTRQPAEAPTEEVAEAEPTLPPEPAVTEAPPAKPTPRQGLAASSPAEVALASGQVQLVEFFAYW